MSGNSECSCSVQYSSNLNESKTVTAKMHRLYPYLLQLTADTEKARPREAKDLSKPIEKAAQTHSVSMNGALTAVRDGEMMCSLRGLDGHSLARSVRKNERGRGDAANSAFLPPLPVEGLPFKDVRPYRRELQEGVGGQQKEVR